MKKLLLPSVFARTVFSIIFCFFGLQEVALAQTQISKPGQSMLYLDSGQVAPYWQLVNHSYYTYNPGGFLTEILTTNGNHQNESKKVISYDQAGNETVVVQSVWRNGAWQDFPYRNVYIYNANNKVLSNTRQYQVNGNWENEFRTLNTFTNGLISEIMVQRYDSSAWTDVLKEFDFTWHLPNKKASAYRVQFKQNNAWADGSRYSVVYDVNGGSISTQEIWLNNSWVNYARNTLTHDLSGNEVNYLSERWLNGTWKFYLQNAKPITYSPAGDILEQYSSISCISCTPGQATKTVYANFQYFTIAGLKNEIPQEIVANVFPNPVLENLTIEIPANNSPVKVQLSDLSGKIVLTSQFEGEETKKMNIEKLPAGIYLLHLQTEKGKTVQKIVKN